MPEDTAVVDAFWEAVDAIDFDITRDCGPKSAQKAAAISKDRGVWPGRARDYYQKILEKTKIQFSIMWNHPDSPRPNSSDGYWDFCAHVIGCGREVWEKSISRMDLQFTRMTSQNYSENFGYLFHTIDEVAEIRVMPESELLRHTNRLWLTDEAKHHYLHRLDNDHEIPVRCKHTVCEEAV